MPTTDINPAEDMNPEPPPWQMIDFAPKDGTRILGRDRLGWREMWWKEDLYEGAFWQDHFDSEPDPDVWVPLPSNT